jgi:predicted transcriptional regulator
MPDEIHIRTPPAFRRRLEELATARKTTISEAIRSAVLQATVPERGIPSEQEVLELLGEAARAGNVAAMRELRTYHREQDVVGADPLAEFDELATRRAAR